MFAARTALFCGRVWLRINICMRTFSGTSVPLANRSHLSRNRFPCNPLQYSTPRIHCGTHWWICDCVLKGIAELSRHVVRVRIKRQNDLRSLIACVSWPSTFAITNDDGLDVYDMECANRIGSLRWCVWNECDPIFIFDLPTRGIYGYDWRTLARFLWEQRFQ